MVASINTYNEGSLHAALKLQYAADGGEPEVEVDGYIIDVVKGDLLIEIQTRNFSSIKTKLQALTADHRVLLVYPVPRQTWIVKAPRPHDPDGRPSRRKSPKRGSALALFEELVSFPDLICNPNFAVEIAFTHEDQLRHYDRRRGWRRNGWVIDDRVLLDVVETRRYANPEDLATLLPDELPDRFTTADLARVLGRSRRFAQRMTYCLRETGVVDAVGHRRHSVLYRVSE
ncbi:MAG: hypothetical protein JXC32_07140 [Anaerolineae bacterium]|nr:hypothetical protein [Anaerolineae bacterium]